MEECHLCKIIRACATSCSSCSGIGLERVVSTLTSQRVHALSSLIRKAEAISRNARLARSTFLNFHTEANVAMNDKSGTVSLATIIAARGRAPWGRREQLPTSPSCEGPCRGFIETPVVPEVNDEANYALKARNASSSNAGRTGRRCRNSSGKKPRVVHTVMKVACHFAKRLPWDAPPMPCSKCEQHLGRGN